MTAKEYLKQARKLQQTIRVTEMLIEQLRSLSEKTTPTYTDMPTSSPSGSKIDKYACDIVDLEDELIKRREDLREKYFEITQIVLKVKDQQLQDVLTLYYLVGKPWEEVAEILQISVRWVQALHGDALNVVRKIITTSC